jgi:hypothetical protein
MRIIGAIITAVCILQSASADDKSKDLDRKVIALLLDQSEIVVLCHKDTSSNVGMDPRLKTRYGLKDEDSGFGLPVKETIVGPPVKEPVIGFWYSRGPSAEPFFLPQGDYLLFLRHDAKNRWVLVGDFMGLQLFTKGLDDLVKEVHAKKP